MARIHIGKNGPAPCKANKGKCPLGGESGGDNHFDSMEEAETAYAKQQGGSAPKALKKNSDDFNSNVVNAFKNGDVDSIAKLYPEASEPIEGGEYYITPSTVDEEDMFMGDRSFEDEDFDDDWDDESEVSREDSTQYAEIMELRQELYNSRSGDGYDVSNGLISVKDLTPKQKQFMESGKKVAEKIDFDGAVAIDTNKINDDWNENGELSDYQKLQKNIEDSGIRVTNMFDEDSSIDESTTLLFTKDRIITL